MLRRLLFAVLMLLAFAAQATVYSLPWGPKPQFVDANGAPMSGGSLLTFLATSSTAQVTYTDSTGGTANPTTITLNTRGETPNEVWLSAGVAYKIVLKDSAGATVWTIDNVAGVNDVSASVSEWVTGPTPTFVSATSFTLAGDQTTTFTVGRRLKTTNSGGTVYSSIVTSVFGASTTVTVVNDSSVLDNGLSAVSYGLLQATNKSVPPFDSVVYLSTVAGTNTITASATKSAAPLATGQAYRFIPANTNTGATTLNVNSLGAKNIFGGNSALVGGELHASIPVEVVYDGTQFQLQGPITKQPTRQVLTTGTAATYTTPTGATRLWIRMVGGGGGGGSSAANGTTGTASTFNSVNANPGALGNGGGSNTAGAGGSAGTGTASFRIGGSAGSQGSEKTGAGTGNNIGGNGGSSVFSGAGLGGNGAVNTGGGAATNSGSGGGGAGGAATVAAGGGGAGEYVELVIVGPATTYTYTVGASGAGGAGGSTGGAGAAGIIIVDEYYN